jgi:3-phenylpropionate/trans-cinnamate dioxygenase ferredoxin subunit
MTGLLAAPKTGQPCLISTKFLANNIDAGRPEDSLGPAQRPWPETKPVSKFVEIALLDQLPPGTSMVVTVAGNVVALFNVDGLIDAIADSCIHAGNSFGAARPDGNVVTCSGHGWRYDITTGCVVGIPGLGTDSYQTKIVDGKS